MKQNNKEKELMELIRTGNYKKITIIRTKNGLKVYGESIHEAEGMSEKEILESFAEKDFSTVEIIKRNGKVVHYRVEDVFKF